MSGQSDCVDLLFEDSGLGYCRDCDALQPFHWVGSGYDEPWDCAHCGETHVTEGYRWECAVCGFAGDPIARLKKQLTRLRERRRAVDRAS